MHSMSWSLTLSVQRFCFALEECVRGWLARKLQDTMPPGGPGKHHLPSTVKEPGTPFFPQQEQTLFLFY